MPKCPRCGYIVQKLFKCNVCGDVRCDSTGTGKNDGACASPKGPDGGHGGATLHGLCKSCKKGKYERIN